MNIVLIADKVYLDYALLSISSALRHNPGADVYLMLFDAGEADFERARSVTAPMDGRVTLMDISRQASELIKEYSSDIRTIQYFLRYLIPELLPDLDRVLHIDCDIIVADNLEEMYATDIAGHPCAMVQDIPTYYLNQKETGLPPEIPYYNAGVFLINMPYWREHRLGRKMIDKYFADGAKYKLRDQAVANIVMARDTVSLPYRYNVITTAIKWHVPMIERLNMKGAPFNPAWAIEARRNPAVVHYTGPGARPWQKGFYNVHGSYWRKEWRRMGCRPALTDDNSSYWKTLMYKLLCRARSIYYRYTDSRLSRRLKKENRERIRK